MKAKRILVIAAHPDDEALGCGGTLARHAREGDQVFAMFMTNGVGARGSDKGAGERKKAAEKAAKALGISKVFYEGFPDNGMDGVATLKVAKAVEAVIAKVKPHIVYTHHTGDLNGDHRVTARAALTACRPMPGSSVEAIYGMEVLSSTGWNAPENAFGPGHFVNVSKDFAAKMKALKAYDVEMRPFPHARSYEAVEAMAIFRGAVVGVLKAEAFTVLRSIRK